MIRNYRAMVADAQKALSIYGIDLAIRKECKNPNSVEFMGTTCEEAKERAAQCLKKVKEYTNSYYQTFYGVEVRVSGVDYLVSTVEEYEQLIMPTL